jgi:hypothetical protein
MEIIKSVKCNITSIPVKTSTNLDLLINELEEVSNSDSLLFSSYAKEILNRLKANSKFLEDDIELESVKEDAEVFPLILDYIGSPSRDNSKIMAITGPLSQDVMFSSQAYKDTIGLEGAEINLVNKSIENKSIVTSIFHTYMIIINKMYGIDMSEEVPNVLKVRSPDDSVQYYNVKFDLRYLQVIAKDTSNVLSKERLHELFNNGSNLDYWNKVLPMDNVEFKGFILSHYTKVSRSHLISELKSDLVKSDAFVNEQSFESIREKVRSLIEKPNLELGLALSRESSSKNCNTSLINGIVKLDNLKIESLEGTIFENVMTTRGIIITEDFKQLDDVVSKTYYAKGIRSHALIPLLLDGDMVGAMEMGSSEPGDIRMFDVMKIFDLYPVFALAAKRSNEFWSDHIRALIQKKFTAIHPTVEWRFQQAVSDLMLNERSDTSTIEPIVFNDIVPIYGASDIRSSTIERSKAVQSDLKEQLTEAKNVLENHTHISDMPLLDDLRFKINFQIDKVESGLDAGDEFSIVDFLKKEVNPTFELLKNRFGDDQDLIANYIARIDPELGILYKKRKEFEDSLTMINNKVSEILEQEQVNAQKIYPHYFEKYRTDGVEYNAYIGQSLVQDTEYNDIYLKNIRLWQLFVKVKIARAIKDLQSELAVKLDITQLVLVHSNPFSIEFRQDEKKFDVAGAYNIRYEITKKRIDKACIKGTNERITQVGKIAVIYSHVDEINDYRNFINYMVSKGYLLDTIEELELEDLKGASGLKALRLAVNYEE